MVRSYLILAMCGLFLIQYFLKMQWLSHVVVALAVLAFIACATNASRFPRWIGIMMMVTGIVLEFEKGAGIAGISEGILLILPLLCLVTLAPLISIPLKLGGYFESVEKLLQNLLHHPRRLFAGVTSSLFILSPILSLGAVRIIHDFLEHLKLPAGMSAKGYISGFSSAVLWSPYFASVSLTLYYLDMPFSSYILYGIGLSILSLVVANLLFIFWSRKHPLESQSVPEVPLGKRNRSQLIYLAIFVVMLISTSLLIEYVTKWSMIVIVSLMSIILPLVWGAIGSNWGRLQPQLKAFREQSVPMMNNEIMLFTSAGLLGHAVQGTNFANAISDFLTRVAAHSFLLFALSVMVIVLTVTYVGIHQIAVVAALAMQLNAQELGISNLSLALLLLLAWSTSTALSPFSGLNLMVGRFLGKSGVQVGLRANGLHLFVITIIAIGIITMLS